MKLSPAQEPSPYRRYPVDAADFKIVDPFTLQAPKMCGHKEERCAEKCLDMIQTAFYALPD